MNIELRWEVGGLLHSENIEDVFNRQTSQQGKRLFAMRMCQMFGRIGILHIQSSLQHDHPIVILTTKQRTIIEKNFSTLVAGQLPSEPPGSLYTLSTLSTPEERQNQKIFSCI